MPPIVAALTFFKGMPLQSSGVLIETASGYAYVTTSAYFCNSSIDREARSKDLYSANGYAKPNRSKALPSMFLGATFSQIQ